MSGRVLSSTFQIPRNCLAALMVAQIAVLTPHLGRLPIWISLVCAIAAVWRIMLYTGRGFYPTTLARFVLVVVGSAGVVIHYKSLFSLEPIVAFFILAYALKLIEMKSQRDVLIVIFLAYVVGATHFLFRQQIVDALYTVVSMTLVTGALVALHQNDRQAHLFDAYRAAAKLLLQAVPLMAIMFVVFPRIAPLWAVPNTESIGKTGPSDTMSPGDIAELANSSGLAFRVEFNGKVPPLSELYWRGLVLNHFDGRQWRAADASNAIVTTLPGTAEKTARRSTTSITDRSGDDRSLDYSVLIEPNQQSWLYAIASATSSSTGVVRGPDFTLRARSPIRSQFAYNVSTRQDGLRETMLSEPRARTELQLPGQFNPQTRKLARRLRDESDTPLEFAQKVLSLFRDQAFSYTLKPGLLGQHSIDEFLFRTRKGFCEHYASSFVFLMRAGGVPSRVVVGYQGGEINPYKQHLLVHQYDAHAWAEIWIKDRGWMRVDPTAVIAPERVERGMNDLLADDRLQSSSISRLGLRQVPVLRWLRLRWDAVNYSWSKWVLNYDSDKQLSVLQKWLGEVTPLRLAVLILAGGGIVMVLIAISLLRHRVKRLLHPADRIYLRHATVMRRLGFERGINEGVHDYAKRIGETFPHLAAPAQAIANQYSKIRYEQPASSGGHTPNPPDQQAQKKLAYLVSQFSRRTRDRHSKKRTREENERQTLQRANPRGRERETDTPTSESESTGDRHSVESVF